MKCLELFSGTGSVGKILEKWGHSVVSVDRDRKESTHTEDILKWDYKQYPKGYFNYIHMSPPCASFSIYNQSHYGKERWIQGVKKIFNEKEHYSLIEREGLPLLQKGLEIIEYFNPKFWTCENPRNGKMREFMGNRPFTDVSYCNYGYDYQKNTRIWNNFKFSGLYCKGETRCSHKKKHGRHSNGIQTREGHSGTTLYERYSIPPDLVENLIYQMEAILSTNY